MNVKSLAYADPRDLGWLFDTVQLKEGINLFVGASASGKTRILNVLFNIGVSAARERATNGQWTIHFAHSGIEYTWKYDGALSDDREARTVSEDLWVGTPSRVDRTIYSRSESGFHFDTREVPKLSATSSAIYLLREEGAIKPVYEAFSRIMRQRFWSEDLSRAVSLQPIPRQVIKTLDRRADMLEIFKLQGVNLHVVLYLLDRYFKADFEVIRDQFRRVFPFVQDLVVRTAAEALNLPLGADVPVVLLKERGIKKPVGLTDVSSGMQKVLLIITDVLTSPPDVLYMIDEYENSLGVNAIDFLPSFLAEYGGARQFIITTHHPLLINAIPVSDWFIFHRKGLEIKVTPGRDIESRYSRSKQQRFTQLINDPIYTDGVE